MTELIDLSGTEIPCDVTVEQLLNHTSGIADDADEETGENYSVLFTESPITQFVNAGILKIIFFSSILTAMLSLQLQLQSLHYVPKRL